MEEIKLLYVTAASVDEARSIASSLVSDRLVACANIFPAMESFYWWEGAVQNAREAVIVFKTRADLVERVTARVVELHSYTCPCVLVLPVQGGHSGFLAWITAQTQTPATR